MAAFKDSTGQEWILALDIGLIRDIKAATGLNVNISKSAEAATSAAELIFGDPEALSNVLWLMVREQANAKGVSEDEFLRRLNPESLDRAGDAFMEAMLKMAHRRRTGAILPNVSEIMKKVDQVVSEKISKSMEEFLETDLVTNPNPEVS